MEIYWSDPRLENGAKLHRPEAFHLTKKEKELGYLLVTEEDIERYDSVYLGIISSLKKFIDEELNEESYSEYQFLKDLIYSEQKENLIIAWTIINNI